MKPQTFRRRINRSDLPDKARHVAHVMATDADFQTTPIEEESRGEVHRR